MVANRVVVSCRSRRITIIYCLLLVVGMSMTVVRTVAYRSSRAATFFVSLNNNNNNSIFNNCSSRVFKKKQFTNNKETDRLFCTTSEEHNNNGVTINEEEGNHHNKNNKNKNKDKNNKMIYPMEMSEEEKYLFDLNGFVVIRNVLSKDEVKAANDAIDRHEDDMIERSEDALRNAVKGTVMYGNGTGRKDLGGVLEWDKDDSKIFKLLLAHPRLVPLFHGLLGKGYRMDHLPFVIAQDKGAEGFQLHGGTVDCTSGEYNPHLAYTCHNGNLRCALLGCSLVLTDHNAGFGGFCVVPGSHKSNFKMPPGMVDGKNDHCSDAIVQPVTQAGDVVLFSEGTVHGALPWTNTSQQRRICLYRFGPSTHVYGRSYYDSETGTPGWPSKMYNDLNDAQRAVLEPPYANRLDRPEIVPQNPQTVSISSRSDRKKQHDAQLFGTKYF